jgi:hypothetical protein
MKASYRGTHRGTLLRMGSSVLLAWSILPDQAKVGLIASKGCCTAVRRIFQENLTRRE